MCHWRTRQSWRIIFIIPKRYQSRGDRPESGQRNKGGRGTLHEPNWDHSGHIRILTQCHSLRASKLPPFTFIKRQLISIWNFASLKPSPWFLPATFFSFTALTISGNHNSSYHSGQNTWSHPWHFFFSHSTSCTPVIPVSSLFTRSSESHHVLLPMHEHSSLEHGHSFYLVLLLLPLRWPTCQRKSFKRNTDHEVFCPGLLDFILLRIKSRILSTVDRAYIYLSMTGFPVSFSTFQVLLHEGHLLPSILTVFVVICSSV